MNLPRVTPAFREAEVYPERLQGSRRAGMTLEATDVDPKRLPWPHYPRHLAFVHLRAYTGEQWPTMIP